MFHTIIHTDQLASKLEDPSIRIIDCRFSLADKEWGREQYAQGHIPGAQYVHLDDDLSAEIIPGTTGRHPWLSIDSICSLFSRLGISNDTQIVVYDQSHSGIAARFWAMALSVGHEQVCVLNGGWKQWNATDLPISTHVKSYEQSNFLASPPMLSLINVDDLTSLDTIIDARTEKRYKGIEEPIDPIAGHVPNAINIPFLGNVDENHLWLSKEELVKRFSKVQGASGIYCGSGVTACHDLIAMKHAGLELPSLYPGSWSHYITDANRPVVSEST